MKMCAICKTTLVENRKRLCPVCCLQKRRERQYERYKKYKAEIHAQTNRRRNALRKNYPWLQPIDSAKQRAAKTGKQFNLTQEWAIKNWTGLCSVSGLPFDTMTNGKRGPRMFGPSIDRIDAAKGYTQDNCRFVLLAVNSLKHNGTDAQMFRVAAAILLNNGFKVSK